MPETPNDDIQKIDELCAEFLRRLKAGEAPDRSSLVAENASLPPELDRRLESIETAFAAAKSTSEPVNSPDGNASDVLELAESAISQTKDSVAAIQPFHQHARRISCPHCGNVVQLVSREQAEVTCASCGSGITFDADLSGTDRPIELPVQIGRFQIMRLLGEGAFGAVFLASDPQLKRQVALKVPRAGYFHSASEEQRFYREAQSAAKLSHPNIVPVHEISQEKSTPYIVSEFIDGVTMSDLASTGLLTFREIAELMLKVCDAVQHAHGKGVIHRDLKPGNIMVDSERNPWVADFGLARRDDAEITMTVDGMVLGTPAYMAPEQAAGIHQKVDARSDIYSLGVVLYKLLARELPFSGTRRMLLHQVLHDDPRSPRKFNDNIPKDLETITLKALNKEQENRFQTAGEFKSELERWLNGRPILSRPVGPGTRFLKWCKRYPLIATLCSAILFLLLCGTAFAWYKAEREREIRMNAVAKSIESNNRLHQIFQDRASQSIDRNRLLESGYWYAKSLELKDSPLDRRRLQAVYERSPKLQAVFPVDSKLELARFSDDGRRLALGTVKGKVTVYELATRKVIFEASNEESFPVFQLEFLNDNKFLLFRSANDTSQIWDIENGRIVCSLDLTLKRQVKHAAINGARKKVAIAGNDSNVEILSAQDGGLIQRIKIEGRGLRYLRFVSPERLLIGEFPESNGESKFSLVDASNGEVIWTTKLDAGAEVFLAEDGSQLATVRDRKLFQLLDLQTGKKAGQAFESNFAIRDALLTGGDTAVLLSEDRQLQTIKPSDGSLLGAPHFLEFRPVKLKPVGGSRLFASISSTGELQFVDPKGWLETLSRIAGAGQVEFNSDGSLAAISGERYVGLWSLAGAIPRFKEFHHEGMVRNGLFSPDGKLCYTIGDDGKAMIWDAEAGKRVGAVMSHGSIIGCCELTPDGQRLITGSYDKTVKVWDALTGQQIGPEFPHRSAVVRVAVSPDGKSLLAGCFDGSCFCWKLGVDEGDEPSPAYEVKLPALATHIEYTPDGQRFVTMAYQGVVRFWDSSTGNPKGTIKSETIARACKLSPDGQLVAVAWQGKQIGIYRVDDQSQVAMFDVAGDVMHLEYDSNGRLRVSDFSGTTGIWEDVGGQFVKRVAFRHHSLTGLQHSDQRVVGGLVVSAGRSDVGKSGGGVAAVWSEQDGKLVLPPFFQGGRILRARFSPRGSKILTSAEDGKARLWDLESTQDPDDLSRMFVAIHELQSSMPDVDEEVSKLLESPFFEVPRLQQKRWREIYSEALKAQ